MCNQLKIHKVNLEEADFRNLLTHLKLVGLTRVMSQIKAKTKKEFTSGVWRQKFVSLPGKEKIAAGVPYGPPLVNERLDLKLFTNGFRLKKVLHKVLQLFFYWGGHIDPPPVLGGSGLLLTL